MRREQYYKNVMDPIDFAKITQLATINELLVSMKKYDNLLAIEDVNQKKTYRELLRDVSTTRGFFIENGFKAGEHIGLCLDNEYDFIRIFLAITSLGMVAVILPPHLLKSGIKEIFKRMDLTIVIHGHEELSSVVKSIRKEQVVSDTITLGNENVEKTTPAAIIFTSGTTNLPRGAVLSHGNLMRGTINGTYGYQKSYHQRYYAIIPFTHVFGLIRSCLTPLYTGSSIFLSANMSELVNNFPKAQPTILVLVPALAEMVYGLIKMRGIEAIGGNLHTIICGGAQVPLQLPALFLEYGINLFPGYGLTESSNLVSGSVLSQTNPATVGMVYPLLQTKVVGGELWIKGDAVMIGYYKDDVANQESFEDGWFKTGDLVRFDEEKMLYIVGRLKNILVLSNGENVSPEMLEEKLAEISFVKASVVSSKKTGLGEVIVAEVFFDQTIITKMKIENPQKTFKEQLDAINKKLPPYMMIRQAIIRETDFPRSASMKIIRGNRNDI